jgi:hypothetical protein
MRAQVVAAAFTLFDLVRVVRRFVGLTLGRAGTMCLVSETE